MKGIILAGGSGSRLHPLSLTISKQLLPVYNKPMIYYPLSTLLMAGIKEILIISTPQDLPHFERLLGDGSQLGCSFTYAKQAKPEGIAQAFTIAEGFIGTDSVALILGDNLFYDDQLTELLQQCTKDLITGGCIFAYQVANPTRYGVVDFDSADKALSIEEKPLKPKSNYVVPGLYFYDHGVVEIAKSLKLSARGEYEITDINQAYLTKSKLQVKKLNEKTIWLDTGTFDSLLQASNFVQMIQKSKDLQIGYPEEAAFRMGFIDATQLKKLAEPLLQNSYGKYLLQILQKKP